MKSAIRITAGLIVIALFALAGDLVLLLTGLPVPSSIVGMALFAGVLAVVPKLRAVVARAATLLTGLLGALIVPPFLGLALFREELAAHLLPVAVILFFTTPLTALATALAYRALRGKAG
ncbi:MAG: CidA/LrgA family protein [Pacificimonas sp.]